LPSTTAASERAVKRLHREARALASLKSAHIVQIHDFGVDGGVPFLVMELLVGEPLSERLARVGKLPLDQAVAMVQQACRGLAAAHAQGIVHRDIKPSNLFVARTPEGEVLKILDFGLAKPLHQDGSVTLSREILGTPLYMSPEHIDGVSLDSRADLWSLSAVAFLMLTGADAFRSPHTSAVLARIGSGEAPAASAVAPEVSSRVDAFFARAFAKQIDLRFQNSTELAREFAALVAPEDESAIEAEFFRSSDTLSMGGIDAAPRRAHGGRRWWTAGLIAIVALLLVGLGLSGARRQTSPAAQPAAASSPALATSPAPQRPATSEPIAVPTVPPPASAPAPVRFGNASRSSPLGNPRAPAPPAPSASTPPAAVSKKTFDPMFGL